MRIFGTKTINMTPLTKKIILIAVSIFVIFLQNLKAQPPVCTGDDCGLITPEWSLVGDGQISVCEGTPFELTAENSSPLSNIDDFHWYIMDQNFNIFFDTLRNTPAPFSYQIDDIPDSVARVSM